MARRQAKTTEHAEAAELQIIGGEFRGRKLHYGNFRQGSDPVTRPMKHRVREAIFNLISTDSQGRHAIDLFAGTGALGLEAVSRGAVSATLIEKHVPTARIVQQNIAELGVEQRVQLLTTSAFLWSKRDLPKAEIGKRKAESGVSENSALGFPPSSIPWLVFCSPPYAFYVERRDDMLALMAAVMEHAPEGSIMVVEADERFDFSLLPGKVAADRREEGWNVRSYPPAVIGIWRT